MIFGGVFIFPNPLNPLNASKHNFASLKNDLISYTWWVPEQTFSCNCFNNNKIFFSFAIHFKSSSTTTSQELRQQFVAVVDEDDN